MTLLAYLSGCTEAVVMHPRDLLDQRDFTQPMVVRLNNGEQIETENITVTEKSVTIRVLKGGKVLEPPRVVPLIDVDSISMIQDDASNTGAAVVLIGLAVTVVALFVILISGSYSFPI